MDIGATLKELGLQSALIIDDAYALPAPADIDDEARGGFLKAIRDEEETRAALLRGQFKGLQTDADGPIVGLLGDSTSVSTLWDLYKSDVRYSWCKTAFEGYEAAAAGKRQYTDHLEKYLGEIAIGFETRASLSPQDAVADEITLLFVDFFLIENEHPDDALKRAVAIAQRFVAPRMVSGKVVRPLLFLISNRPETRGYVEYFRNASHLKGSFFRFLDKSELKPGGSLVSTLQHVLERYPPAMLLADYLDTFRTTAQKAVQEISDRFDELELTDLSLLHYLRIEAEHDRLGRYTSWLFSESISNWLQSNPDVRSAGAKLDSLVYHSVDGKAADPRNVLFRLC